TYPKPRYHSHSQAFTYEQMMRPYAVLKLELDERVYAKFGLEMRYPFYDSRLVEFMLALPWEQRSSGHRKQILRDALRGIVPDSILARRDKGDHTSETDRGLSFFCAGKNPEPLQNR